MFVLLACTDPATPTDAGLSGDTGSAGTDSVDTAATGDSGDSTETGDTGESGDTADSGDTGPEETGSLFNEATLGGVPQALVCGAGSESTFTHTFVDAMGDTAGSVSCSAADGARFVLNLTSGGEGSWTSPDGADFSYAAPDGTTLAYSTSGLTTTAWSLAIPTFTRTSTQSIDMEATWSGAWSDSDGAAFATLSGALSVELRCDGC